jgi:hypothetical protein
MCKHVDLIAVAVLLCTFGFAARVHQVVSLEVSRTHVLRAFPARPITVAPPPTPRLPHFPRVKI